jgi:cellulose synthase/poly-beta-1,6-N-acetylglucosamine synthase-like glycosyltransferase
VSTLSSKTETSGPALPVRIAVVLAIVASLRYFTWRITDTMNPAVAWFFYLFLAAELVGFGEVLLFYLTTWSRRLHRDQPALPNRTVDLFIPTYNEPVALLRDTVVCAVSVRYPHTTWLLDDGNRPAVKALAEELGCRYLARSERTHAKAGNLNHALAHSSGDFVVTLDADHVPQPDLIDRLLGFFENPKVAIVQVNQDFYNLDSFQHTTNWEDRAAWQQQELFFNVIQPGKDALGAAMYCGSPAMLRRSALEEIGGFATETVTEDMHTGLRLQKRGWEVVFYNRTLARGLAPQTFDAYRTQWHRWGLGAMQVFRLERPFLGAGLTLRQRLAYLSSFYFYWTSVQKLFFLLIPVFCVATGLFPLLTEPGQYMQYFLPALLLNLVATIALQGGVTGFLLTERYNLIKLGSMLQALSGLVRRKALFKVTPKSKSGSATLLQVSPYLVVVGLLGGSVIGGAFRIVNAKAPNELWAYAVTVSFALFFLYLLVPVVALAFKRRELRDIYRFPQRLELPLRVRMAGSSDTAWIDTYARNLNRFGLSVTLDTGLVREADVELELRLPDRIVNAVASVRWSSRLELGKRVRFANGLRFDGITQEDQDAIARHLFWEVAPRHGEQLTMTHRSQQLAGAVAPARVDAALEV